MGRFVDALTLGPQRRRRSMNRRLAQLDAAYRTGAPAASPRDWGIAEPSSASASPGRLFAVLALIVVVVVGSVFAVRSVTKTATATGSAASPTTKPSRSPSSDRAVDGSRLPPPGVESSPNRLRPAVAPPGGSGGYAFTTTARDGAPIAYDPCRPIHYVVRDGGGPSNGDRLIREAVAAVSDATGLVFVDDGSSTEAPTDSRQAFQPARYGQRWAPVLIAWSNPSESTALAGPTTGTGGSQAVTVSSSDGTSEAAYVTGAITLDAPQLRQTESAEGSAAVRAVVEHELGHVVGLAHVGDKSQLMYPEAGIAVSRYESGDLRGLARLGAGPCTPML
jgi:Matrixin